MEESSSDLAEPLLSETTVSSPQQSQVTSSRTQQQQQQQQQQQEEPIPDEMPTRTFFWATVTVATIPMFLFGLNTGILNAPEPFIFPGHSTLAWSAAVSGFSLGGLAGANVSGSLADTWGRSRGLRTIFWINLVAGLLHMMTPNMGGLILARVLVGLAGGAATVLTPTYLAEIAPTSGSIATLTQLACVVGILASILWELPFESEKGWRFIFLPLPLMSIAGILAAPFVLVESPSWLLLRFPVERRQEALDNLRLLRGLRRHDDDDIIEMIIQDEITAPTTAVEHTSTAALQTTSSPTNDIATAQEEEEGDDQNEPEFDSPESHRVFTAYRSFGSYVLDPKNRIPLISSILFPAAQQLSGINAVFYYSTQLFRGVIANPQTGTIIAFTVNVVATVAAVLLMDRLGRKTLLSVSAGGMFLCCILLTMSLHGSLPGMVTVIGVMMYISFFELGLGCIPFFLSTEMIDPEFAGKVQSLAMSCNWFFNFCVGMFFPFVSALLGPFSFVPFAVILFGTVLYAIFVLPESRGKTPAQVMRELELRRGTAHHPVPTVDTEFTAPSTGTGIV